MKFVFNSIIMLKITKKTFFLDVIIDDIIVNDKIDNYI